MEGIEIRNSESKKGKGLFAKKTFREGEVILEEDPIVSCQFAWNAAYKYVACDHCMRPLETPEDNVKRLSKKQDICLPYPDCVTSELDKIVTCDSCKALYCSETCKDIALSKYHKQICHRKEDVNHPLAQLVEAWKQIHYPPETTNIMLLVRILAYIKQSINPEETVSEIKQFCHRAVNEDAELVHKLLGEQFSEQLSMLRDMTSNAINGEFVDQFLTPEGFCSLVALIGTNGQGVGTSPLSTWVNAVSEIALSDDEKMQLERLIDKIYEYVEEESGTFLNTEGSGLYKIQSACNHSCAPNAEPAFPYSSHRLQLKALKDINPGEEIYISYLDVCGLNRSRHSRQKELALNYLFVCDCQKCQQQMDEPDVTSEEEMNDESEEEEMDD